MSRLVYIVAGLSWIICQWCKVLQFCIVRHCQIGPFMSLMFQTLHQLQAYIVKLVGNTMC